MLVQKEENYTQVDCKSIPDLKELLHEVKALKSMGENIILDFSASQNDPGREYLTPVFEELGKWGVVLGTGDWAQGYMEQEYPVVPTHSEATDYIFMLAIEREL